MPLMFLSQDFVISEATIAYVEVPKVALLRTLAGLIALLWSLEWAIKSSAFQGSLPSISTAVLVEKLRPSKMVAGLNGWLKNHPTRWLILAAFVFYGSTFLSTVLSGSFTNSMWGEIPGQDGYSAYSIGAYCIVFSVIATHLKNKAQLERLLGAVILMGVLVGLYGSLQHYGHDLFSITEITGGGSSRVTIFMGNTIFAAAVLSMTVPITLMTAAISLRLGKPVNWWPFTMLGQLGTRWVFTSLWALALGVQLLGLMFTFSRGPWSGTVLALVAFLGLVCISSGWRDLVRTGLVIGLAGILLVSFLHWQGSVTVVDLGPWLGFVTACLGLAGVLATLYVIEKYGRTVIIIACVGAVVTIAGAAILGPTALSDRGTADPTNDRTGSASVAGEAVDRITSINTNVLGGFFGGRGTHWKVSWELIKDRPWFAFDHLHLAWLRPLVGYGPDLFRYTYLLESPEEGKDFLPLEPDHAHNFFIHQTVEQGIFGGLASLALFASVFGIAAHHLVRRRRSASPLYTLILLGLAAVILGRFLEMMVGVARISDLTVLWVVFGLFAASASLANVDSETASPAVSQPPRTFTRREKLRAQRGSTTRRPSIGLLFRLAVVAWLIGGIGVVTWQKGINPVRAAVADAQASKHFQKGDLASTVDEFDKAIRLAPGIPNYYHNRALTYLVYQLNPDAFTEPDCEQQQEMSYTVCLGIQSLESNLESVNRQPFNYRARLAAGNSAFNLQLHDVAVESYEAAARMLPNAFGIRNVLAESLIETGQYEKALTELDWSLRITGDSVESQTALLLKSTALQRLGKLDDALSTVNQGLLLGYGPGLAQTRLNIIRDIVNELGVRLDLEHFDAKINKDPQDEISYYLRGLAHLALGDAESANLDIRKSYDLGLQLGEVLANRGYARLKVNDLDGAGSDLSSAVEATPKNALFNAYLGEYLMARGKYAGALNSLENASILDPELGLANLIRGKIFMTLGLEESAKKALATSSGLNLPTAQDYVDRGEIYAVLGDYDLAFSDLNEAIRISPNQAKYYNARAKAHAIFNDFETAIADFNDAIQRDSQGSEYFVNRGVVYDILGETELASADFAIAKSLDYVAPSSLDGRNTSNFTGYTEIPYDELGSALLLNLQNDRQALRTIEFHSAQKSGSQKYVMALQILGQAHIELGMWTAAADRFSKLIELSPMVPEAYRFRGRSYQALKRYTDAIKDFDQAVLLGSLDGENFLARGQAYAEIGESDLARADFTEAIRLNPDFSDAYVSLGYLSVQSGNYSSALSDINRAIEISPLNHDAYSKRASAYIGLGQTSLALEDLERASKLKPSDSDYLYQRGQLRYELEDYDLAINDFNGAILLNEGSTHVDPRDARPFISRGRAYLQIGNPNQSLDDAVQAIKLLENNISSADWDGSKLAVNTQLANAQQLLWDVSKMAVNTQLANTQQLLDDANRTSSIRWAEHNES